MIDMCLTKRTQRNKPRDSGAKICLERYAFFQRFCRPVVGTVKLLIYLAYVLPLNEAGDSYQAKTAFINVKCVTKVNPPNTVVVHDNLMNYIYCDTLR